MLKTEAPLKLIAVFLLPVASASGVGSFPSRQLPVKSNYWANKVSLHSVNFIYLKAKIARALSLTPVFGRPWIPAEDTDGGISPPDHQSNGISTCYASDVSDLTFVGGPPSTLQIGGRKVSSVRVLNVGPSPNLGNEPIGGESGNYIIMNNGPKADPLPCPITGCIPLLQVTCRWSSIESLIWIGTMGPRAFSYRLIKSEIAFIPHALFCSLNLEAFSPCEDIFQSLKQIQSNFSYSEFLTAFYGDRIREDPAFVSEATSHLQ